MARPGDMQIHHPHALNFLHLIIGLEIQNFRLDSVEPCMEINN